MPEFADLTVGLSVGKRFTFSAEAVRRFADLVEDHAPVHFDEAFAAAQKFKGRIVHGFFISSIVSGLLGEQLPGPKSVINSMTLKFHAPVHIGETIAYQARIKQLSSAVQAVVLDLTAKNDDGTIVASGTAMCSFVQSAP